MDALFGLLSSSCWTVFLFLPSLLTLCVCVSLYAPSSSSLSCETLALTVVETTSPQPCSFFCLTLHLSLFSYTPLCQFLFFCAVVRVSGLFSFKLNTFQLCMNHTSHKSGYAKADVTELPLHVYVTNVGARTSLRTHENISVTGYSRGDFHVCACVLGSRWH